MGGCRGRGDCAAFLVRALYKITNDLYNSELKSCVKVEVAVGLMAYGFCGRKAILQPTKFISCFLFCFLSAEHFGWQTAAPTSTPTKSTMLLGRHTSVITVLTCPSTKLAILLRANRYCPRVSDRQASVGITSTIAGLPCCCGVSKRQLGAPRRGQKGRRGGGGGSQGRGLQIPSAEMTESESERAQVHHTHWT